MAEQRLKIPRLGDRAVFNCFAELAKKHSIPNIHIQVLGFANLGEVSVANESDGILKLLLDQNNALIEHITMHLQGLSIAYHRGGNYQAADKSAVYDEICFNQGSQTPLANDIKIEIVSFFAKKLKAYDPKRVVSKGLSDEQAALEALHNATLERLEKLSEDLIVKNTNFRQNLEQEFSEKNKYLEAFTDNKRSELEQEYQKRHAELNNKADELEKRRTELDDRNNTHVRRGLREALQTELKNRQQCFRLTKDTIELRKPIHFACWFFTIAFGMASFFYAQELYAAVQKELSFHTALIALKPIGLTATTIGIAIFYLRWLNRWFEQHAQAEFHLKQFQLDVDRASWVVETALEWKTSLGTAIPTVLMESITRNLFQAENKTTETPLHPGDQLASALLGTASKVRVKAGDAELEFDGKRLKKEMQKD